jgi:hypothetical protein
MGRYTDDAETMDRRIARGLIVQEYGPEDVDALDWIAREKRNRLR